ncbi:Protein translocase subunit [Frankliniella fusca]|uniref:Protein translocase subunit n=1 Tax=Frankliniella fusca TaxID=407009 RepID=A0AAE1LDG2_9NEOP|nr:Protein translocase subunit [Frankliniella fusca]
MGCSVLVQSKLLRNRPFRRLQRTDVLFTPISRGADNDCNFSLGVVFHSEGRLRASELLSKMHCPENS